MQRYLKFLPLILILFVIGFYAVSQKGSTTVTPTPIPLQEVLGETDREVKSKATVVLNFGDRQSTYENVEGKTVFDTLKKVTADNTIPLEYTTYDFGVFIKTIGDKTNTQELSWIYYVNGKSADKASDTYELQPGDTIEWKFLKPTF